MFWQLQDSKKRALAVFRKTSFVSFALTDSLLPLSFFLSAARIAFWPLQSQSLCLLAEPKDPLLSKIIENTLLFLLFLFSFLAQGLHELLEAGWFCWRPKCSRD